MKWFFYLLVIMLIAVVCLYIYSGIVYKQRNSGSLSKTYAISEKAKEIILNIIKTGSADQAHEARILNLQIS